MQYIYNIYDNYILYYYYHFLCGYNTERMNSIVIGQIDASIHRAAQKKCDEKKYYSREFEVDQSSRERFIGAVIINQTVNKDISEKRNEPNPQSPAITKKSQSQVQTKQQVSRTADAGSQVQRGKQASRMTIKYTIMIHCDQKILIKPGASTKVGTAAGRH